MNGEKLSICVILFVTSFISEYNVIKKKEEEILMCFEIQLR